MIRIGILLFCGFLIRCSGKPEISEDRYIRFAAKQKLIREYFKNRPDSLNLYMAGLYASESVNPEQLRAFHDAANSKPEQWITIQQKIVAELEKLNPAKPAPVPDKR